MRAVVQRVTDADCTVNNKLTCAVKKGFVVFLGVEDGDSEADCDYIAKKVAQMRIFEDKDEKMNLSISDVNGSVLSISQFTLLGDVRKGNRPSFTKAAKPDCAKELYEVFNGKLREQGIQVEEGIFRAEMLIRINNDGPVTILLDSRKLF